MPDIQAFREWQQAGYRSVTITLGEAGEKDLIRVWVYDYDLMTGQHVKSVDEIDLMKVMEKELEAKIQQMKKLTGKDEANG